MQLRVPAPRQVDLSEVLLQRLFSRFSGIVTDEDQLRADWTDPDDREHFLRHFADSGYDAERSKEIRSFSMRRRLRITIRMMSFVDRKPGVGVAGNQAIHNQIMQPNRVQFRS